MAVFHCLYVCARRLQISILIIQEPVALAMPSVDSGLAKNQCSVSLTDPSCPHGTADP